MIQFPEIGDLHQTLTYIVPGLIIVFIRMQFLTGRIPKQSESILSYFTLSAIYLALALPAYDWINANQTDPTLKSMAWFALIFITPAAIGLLLGINAQTGFTRHIARRIKLNPVHALPSAWDWTFSNGNQRWVLVTLKDGTRFAGYCGNNSFFSSDPLERDILIEKVYDLDDDDTWLDVGPKSVLIASSEIQTVEFWPVA